MRDNLDGKVALVTGAGGGIGRASALAFAQAGASVMVADIVGDAAAAVAQEISAAGGRAEAMAVDITDAVQLRALHEQTVAHFGGLDFAHNNAGASKGPDGLLGLSAEDWDWTFGLCIKATFLSMQLQVPLLQQRGGGAIINTASMSGVRNSQAANAAYSSAKAGVIRLTQYTAFQHAKDFIRVNAVSPGLVRTKAIDDYFPKEKQQEIAASLHAIPRIIEPEEIAAAVVFLCSPGAAMITGQNLQVDGGQGVRP